MAPDLSQLKICFIAGTLGQGGAERQLFYMIRALKNTGSKVRVLSLTRGEFWESRIEELGVPVTWVGVSEVRMRRLSRIIAALKHDQPNIIQSQHFFTNLYAVASARALGCREIGAIRNDGVSELRDTGKLLGRLCLRAPRVIAANSRAAIMSAKRMGVPDERLHFLPNVVDSRTFHPVERSNNHGITVLGAGRLVAQKRFDRFIRLISMLNGRANTSIRAILVGEGPHRERLERLAAEHGLLGNTIEFRGTIADMAPIYGEADIFLSTSDWEGTPNVILEAMASGLPVVSTRVGGVLDLVRDGETGFLADAGDETRMADQLVRLIGDEKVRRRVGTEGRRFVEKNHSPEGVARRLSEVYSFALS